MVDTINRRSFIGSLIALMTVKFDYKPKQTIYASSLRRRISRKYVDRLKDSIASIGMVNHILVDQKTNVAIDGYLRLVAVKELLDEGIIVNVPICTYDPIRYFNVASNDLRIILE